MNIGDDRQAGLAGLRRAGSEPDAVLRRQENARLYEAPVGDEGRDNKACSRREANGVLLSGD